MPLPLSTQRQLIKEVGGVAQPIFQVRKRKAANADIIHNNDTYIKITDLIRLNRTNPPKERTGMFTTGIFSRTEQHDIVLFYNGTQHAAAILKICLKSAI